MFKNNWTKILTLCYTLNTLLCGFRGDIYENE